MGLLLLVSRDLSRAVQEDKAQTHTVRETVLQALE
jgi:hypothetical protein